MRVIWNKMGCGCSARVFIVVAFVYPLIAIAQQNFDSPVALSNASAQEQQPLEDETFKITEDVDINAVNRNFFKRLFIKRRKEHLAAVNNLVKMNDYARQYKMINLLSQKMFDVIEEKKIILNNYTDTQLSDINLFNLTDSQNNLTDAVSSVLENTALFGDVVLNLPDITHRVLKNLPGWNDTMLWSFNFLNKTRAWVDTATIEMVDLALQELNITERAPNYFNPKRVVQKTVVDLKPKKEKQRKGPTLTRVEL